MKTVNLPTTVLIDPDISYEAKGIYCYLYSRYKFNESQIIQTIFDKYKYHKAIKELIKHDYIEFKGNNVFFLK
jgi:folate-dependent tRNA-U54 methylase TrmFO/GidA